MLLITAIVCPDCDSKFENDVNYCNNCRFNFKENKSYEKNEEREIVGAKECPNCKRANDGSIFCIMCGNILFPDLLIQCPKCNHLNSKGSKFCIRCAEKLEEKEKIITCPKCKHENVSPAKFCLKCGTELDADIAFCQSCGAKNHFEAKFCISCGKSVKEKPKNCPKCGAKTAQEMKFCMNCGVKLEV